MATNDLVFRYVDYKIKGIKLPICKFKLPMAYEFTMNSFQFTCVRGIQAGREYYVVMCPLKIASKIFSFDDKELPAEIRAQRILNHARIPEIARYLVDNKDDYVLSSITACIDGDVHFEPFAEQGYGRNAGILTISMTSRCLINDGQHRRAAIEVALREDPRLGDESISVVFFVDAGLERSQQWFTDLNKHAVRPTKSLGILYDQRDEMSHLSRELMARVPIFYGLTEVERTTISNRSSKLFTLNAIFQATKALLGKRRRDLVSQGDIDIASMYWLTLGEIIPEWRMAIKRQVSTFELRHNYIHSHGVALQSLGIVGHQVLSHWQNDWEVRLKQLEALNWSRANELWFGRSIVRGKMSKARESVILTANAIKQYLDLPLSDEEQNIEQRFQEFTRFC